MTETALTSPTFSLSCKSRPFVFIMGQHLTRQLLSAQASVVNPVPAHAHAHDMPLWLLFIMEYCDWDQRFQLAALSRQWRQNTQVNAFYRFLCERLSAERAIYVPHSLPTRIDWKTLFRQLYRLRDLWGMAKEGFDAKGGKPNMQQESWKINVFARFRPFNPSEDQENNCASVTLPLHQRLQMIKMNRKLGSNRAALQVLAQEGGWFQAKWDSLRNTNSSADCDKSFYADLKGIDGDKLKQLGSGNNAAKTSGRQKIVSKVLSADTLFGRVVMMTPDAGLREFTYDGVLNEKSSQKTVYDSCVKPLVMDLLNGFNATAIVYGQTGETVYTDPFNALHH